MAVTEELMNAVAIMEWKKTQLDFAQKEYNYALKVVYENFDHYDIAEASKILKQ